MTFIAVDERFGMRLVYAIIPIIEMRLMIAVTSTEPGSGTSLVVSLQMRFLST